MPRPNVHAVHIDTLLSNLSHAMLQNQNNFIFPKVFAVVPVDSQSDLYPVYDSSDFNTDEAQVRNDSTESAGSGYNLSDEGYKCKVYAFHKDIGEQISANAGKQFNLQREAMEFVTRKILIRQEMQFVNTYLVSGAWTNTDVGGTNFDQFDEATSTPITMLTEEIEEMLEATGIEPNTLVLGFKVFNALKNHPDFVDRVKYSSSDAVTEQIMAKLIGVQRILVAKSIVATGKGATKTNSFTFGKNALLCYASPTPGLLTPSAGYTFSWNYAGINSIAINKLYIPTKKTLRIEGESAFDCKVVAKDLGKLFTSVIA